MDYLKISILLLQLLNNPTTTTETIDCATLRDKARVEFEQDQTPGPYQNGRNAVYYSLLLEFCSGIRKER